MEKTCWMRLRDSLMGNMARTGLQSTEAPSLIVAEPAARNGPAGESGLSPGMRDAGNDALRGIAIMIVLVIHTTATWASAPPNTLTGRIHAAFAPILGLWLPLFLGISGFYVGRRDICSVADYLEFLQKRLTRIIVPYVIWSVVDFILKYTAGKAVFAELLPGIIFGRICYPFYFIPILIKLYLAYPVLNFCVRNRWRLGLTLLFMTLLWLYPASTRIGWHLHHDRMTEWLFRRTIRLDWALLFFLGVVARRLNLVEWLRAAITPRRRHAAYAMMLGVCLIAAVATFRIDSRFVIVLAATMFLLANIADQAAIARRCKLLTWLGTVSYTIYLIHEPALSYIQMALEPMVTMHPLAIQLPLLIFAIAFPAAIRLMFVKIMGRQASLVVG